MQRISKTGKKRLGLLFGMGLVCLAAIAMILCWKQSITLEGSAKIEDQQTAGAITVQYQNFNQWFHFPCFSGSIELRMADGRQWNCDLSFAPVYRPNEKMWCCTGMCYDTERNTMVPWQMYFNQTLTELVFEMPENDLSFASATDAFIRAVDGFRF